MRYEAVRERDGYCQTRGYALKNPIRNRAVSVQKKARVVDLDTAPACNPHRLLILEVETKKT